MYIAIKQIYTKWTGGNPPTAVGKLMGDNYMYIGCLCYNLNPIINMDFHCNKIVTSVMRYESFYGNCTAKFLLWALLYHT